MRVGQSDEAEKSLNQSLKYSRTVLARDPEDLTQRQVTAAAKERLAILAKKRGDPAESARLYREALEIRTGLAQLEPTNPVAQAALAVAYAHLGRYDESLKLAEVLKTSNADRPAVLLPLARCFAVCTGSERQGRRASALALDALGAAMRNGYRDVVVIRTDPDFAELLAEPGFQSLVDAKKP